MSRRSAVISLVLTLVIAWGSLALTQATGTTPLLGLDLQGQGNLGAASACYRKAIALGPDHAKAHENLVRSRRYSPADRGEIARLEALVCTPKISEEALMSLHFALGKVYDDSGDYDNAFVHFQQGCTLQRAVFNTMRPYRHW